MKVFADKIMNRKRPEEGSNISKKVVEGILA